MTAEKHLTVRTVVASTLWFLCGFVLTPLVMTAAAFGILHGEHLPAPFSAGFIVGAFVYCLGGPILMVIAIVLGKAHVIF